MKEYDKCLPILQHMQLHLLSGTNLISAWRETKETDSKPDLRWTLCNPAAPFVWCVITQQFGELRRHTLRSLLEGRQPGLGNFIEMHLGETGQHRV